MTNPWPPAPNPCSSGRSGLFGPPLCGGSAPATPPLLKPPAAASVRVIRPWRPAATELPPHPASYLVQRREPTQATQRPAAPNTHRAAFPAWAPLVGARTPPKSPVGAPLVGAQTPQIPEGAPLVGALRPLQNPQTISAADAMNSTCLLFPSPMWTEHRKSKANAPKSVI